MPRARTRCCQRIQPTQRRPSIVDEVAGNVSGVSRHGRLHVLGNPLSRRAGSLGVHLRDGERVSSRLWNEAIVAGQVVRVLGRSAQEVVGRRVHPGLVRIRLRLRILVAQAHVALVAAFQGRSNDDLRNRLGGQDEPLRNADAARASLLHGSLEDLPELLSEVVPGHEPSAALAESRRELALYPF
eukprot:scaffold13_cov241-Pinguiococcus_pyrenoidosus.AAC.45